MMARMIFIFVGFLTLAVELSARRPILVLEMCTEDVVAMIEKLETIRVPIGCELIDCCENCPAETRFTWHINLTGQGIREVHLQLAEVSGRLLDTAELSGAVRREEAGFVVSEGKSLVKNVVRFDPAGSGSVLLRVILNPDTLQPQSQTEFYMEQLLGQTVVNSFRFSVLVKPCRTGAATGDQLTLSHRGGDDAAIFADYRAPQSFSPGSASSCQEHARFQTASSVFIGNALSNGPCRGALTVLSDDDTPWFEPNFTDWTDLAGDVVIRSLGPLIEVPVSVWVTAEIKATDLPIQDYFVQTNMLFNKNHVGVVLKWRVCDFYTGTCDILQLNEGDSADATTVIGSGCNDASAVKSSKWFTPDTLNVYFAPNSANINCLSTDANIIYLRTLNNQCCPSRLAHEIGHSFALVDANSQACFTGQFNVMSQGGGGNGPLGALRYFSAGQAFRMNVHREAGPNPRSSKLNLNVVPGTAQTLRQGPTEDCDLTPDNCLPICADLIQY